MILVGSSFFGDNRQGCAAACSFVQAPDLPELGNFTLVSSANSSGAGVYLL
jgi:hypothetical protein